MAGVFIGLRHSTWWALRLYLYKNESREETLVRFREIRLPKLPDVGDMRVWGAVADPYQFLISYDEREKEYRASWKHKDHLDAMACHIGEGFSSYISAESACIATSRQLRQRH
jgi:hypothetical protein